MTTRPLDCRRVRDLLEEHFEGTLPGKRREQVAAHLGQCPACAAEFQQIERISEALAAVPRADPQPALLQALSARTAALPAPDAHRALLRGWRRLGIAAAACLAVLAAFDWMLPHIWARSLPLAAPALAWFRAVALEGALWTASLWDILRAVLDAVGMMAEALGLAATAVAPIVGLYAAAEIGFIAAVVFVLRWRRTKAHPRVMGLLA